MTSDENQQPLFGQQALKDDCVTDNSSEQPWLLLQCALGAMLLFTLGVNLFIGKQMVSLRSQLIEQRMTVMRFTDDYRRANEPLIAKFVVRMQAYANTHPSFRPVLDRYRSALGPYFLQKMPAPAAVPAKSAGTTSPSVPAKIPAK